MAGRTPVSRPKVNSLLFPRATSSGTRSGEAGFPRKSVRWREGERTGEQRVVLSPMLLPRQTDRCPVPGPTPPRASAPGPCRTHTGKEGGLWCLQPPCGNGGDLNHSETRAPGPLTELWTSQPGSERSFHGVDVPTWLVEEGEGLNTNLLPRGRLPPAQQHHSLDGERDREQRLSALLPRTGHSAWALSRGMLTAALSTHAVSASCNRAVAVPSPGAGSCSNPGLPEHGGPAYVRTRNTTEGISTFLHHAITK